MPEPLVEPLPVEPVLPEFMLPVEPVLPVEEPLCEPTEPLVEPVLEDASGVVLLPAEDDGVCEDDEDEGEVLLEAELPV